VGLAEKEPTETTWFEVSPEPPLTGQDAGMTDFVADGSVTGAASGAPVPAHDRTLPVIRRVRADEWASVRDLRLQMLRDPAAAMAFLDTYENAAAQPEAFWQNRTTAAAAAQTVVQYVAEVATGAGAGPTAGARAGGADGPAHWVGSVTGLLEQPGSEDFEGQPVEVRQVHVVGVWLHPEHRGLGLVQRMIDAVVAWGAERAIERARLYVHADNARAQGAYRKAGFAPSGRSFVGSSGPELEMVRPLG
jgi:ribosomal protein S18 acetylase RimI-like enzyme